MNAANYLSPYSSSNQKNKYSAGKTNEEIQFVDRIRDNSGGRVVYTDKVFPLSNRGSPQQNRNSPHNPQAYTERTYEIKSNEKASN